MTENNQPLVSIIVITYNSSKYVLETLESAKAQTYKNIELIISDDASKDNTVEICEAWMEENSERFIRTELVKVSENTGTSANCNRGLKAAGGEWVKYIAGDDILHSSFFTVMEELLCDNGVNFVSGSIYRFRGEVNSNNYYWPTNEIPKTTNEQFLMQVLKGLVIAPAVVLRKKSLISIGGFDETIKIIEDDPTWIRMFKKGNVLNLSTKSIVYYRLKNSHEIMNFYKSPNPQFLKDSIKIDFKYRIPILIQKRYYVKSLVLILKKIFEYGFVLNKCRLNNFIGKILFINIRLLNKIYYLS